VPRINTILLFCVTLLVIGFGSSEALATAYGIAVTGEMLITTVLAVIVFRLVWKWNYATLVVVMGSLFLVELFLFAANLTKFAQGGYLPISVAAILAFSMWTWVTGTSRIQEKSRAGSIPLETLIKSLEDSTHLSRAPGTAVFLTAEAMVAPPALLHNLKHNGVLHSRNFIVSVRTANRPHVPDDEKIVLEPINDSFTRVRLIFGYMDDANVPKALRMKVKFDVMSTSFFLNRRSLRITDKDGMWLWQKRLFLSLFKMATNAHDYYRLPSNRVVELGQQIAI
jgi:KUP system potassium uptake protein